MKHIVIILVFFFNISYAQISDFKNIDFTKADNIAKLHKGEDLENLAILAHKLTNNLPTDVEKFRAIYTWVCNNISGDSNQHNKVRRKRKKHKNDSVGYLNWNDEYKRTAFKKLLKHKKTMCTGYSYLIKELCFLTNIESVVIDGYGRTVESNVEKLENANHSWNAVKLNNKWYLCDATWSSGYMINGSMFKQDYNVGYFLTDPVLFAKNHFPLEKKWFLDDTLINKEFVVAPLVYGEAFTHKVIPVSPNKMNVTVDKNAEIDFSLKPLRNISTENISLIRFIGTDEKAFEIYDVKQENGFITFKHKFKRKGFFDVHLKVNDDIVATYTIDVTNI